ncbi:hypothetical protein ACIRPQ_29065 [Streptomyces sp. NPDC101213]|uniref:hypothetical protein n=1 Tax=Streptomyces sp. NPDC101213 TaxID=3366130 RepID=UPI00380F7F08
MTGTDRQPVRFHVPDIEQARCCPLGSISVDLVTTALGRRDAVAAVHAETWVEHFAAAHPDRDPEPLPGCARCLEDASGAAGRLHRIGHLLLPAPLVTFVEPA